MNKIAQALPVPVGFGAYLLSLAAFLQMAMFVYSAAAGWPAASVIGFAVGMAVAFALSAIGYRIQGLQSGGAIGGAVLDVTVARERAHQRAVAAEMHLGAAPSDERPMLQAA